MTDTFRNYLLSELTKYEERLERIENEIKLAHPEIKPTWEELEGVYNAKKARAEFQLENATQPLFI